MERNIKVKSKFLRYITLYNRETHLFMNTTDGST